MVLRYEIIKGVIGQVIQNPLYTYDEYVQISIDCGLAAEMATYWIDRFINVICNYLAEEPSMDKAVQWLQTQFQVNPSLDQICDKLIAMLAAVWDEDGEILVTKNNQLYRRIQKCDVLELQDLLERKREIEAEIENIMPTDEELLGWARENHPKMIDVKMLQENLDEVNAKIDEFTS